MKKDQQQKFFDMQKRTADKVARALEGYRGAVNLISQDDPDTIVVISFWEDETALNTSYTAIFEAASSELEKNLIAPPDMKNFRVQSGEFFL